jgi:hypothetical protein
MALLSFPESADAHMQQERAAKEKLEAELRERRELAASAAEQRRVASAPTEVKPQSVGGSHPLQDASAADVAAPVGARSSSAARSPSHEHDEDPARRKRRRAYPPGPLQPRASPRDELPGESKSATRASSPPVQVAVLTPATTTNCGGSKGSLMHSPGRCVGVSLGFACFICTGL